MFRKLAYRVQIPLGLSAAVLMTALIVMLVVAQISARTVKKNIIETVGGAINLLAAQARPLLAADDTWRIYSLQRNTVALLPGNSGGHVRTAILDSTGVIVASSQPNDLPTGEQVLTSRASGATLTARFSQLTLTDELNKLEQPDGSISFISPIKSDDGQVLGFALVDIDAEVFKPNWAAIAKPVLIGVLLAVVLLCPVGWWVGWRMTRPISQITSCIAEIGRSDLQGLSELLPNDADPEVSRISTAVRQLLKEIQIRRVAEQRALSAERMAAVGRMTAAVGHEISNPLGGLLTATQTLRMHGQAADTRMQTINLIERGLHQIRHTVAALLPQARAEDRPLELGDFDDITLLAQPAISRYGVLLRAQAQVLSALRVPSAPARQVMLNLLLNAAKAAGPDGWIEANLYADDQVVRFTVVNSGNQLNAQTLEASIAAESGNDPRGFGLWVCREIAVSLTGTFEAIDRDDRATCLVFSIPNRERHDNFAID